MKIYVCVKHVPDTAANIKISGEREYSESIKFVMNPYDEYAVEEAVKTAKAHNGEVVAVSVGKPEAVSTIRSALAVGADRGILVETGGQLPDAHFTAAALKAAILADGPPHIVFTGKQSVDTEAMQTHYRLAAALDIPMINDVTSFSLEDGQAVVECETASGERSVVQMTLPCVIGCTKGLNEPRYPKLPDVLKSKKKPVQTMSSSDLDIQEDALATTLLKLEAVPDRGQAQMMSGDVRKMAADLVAALEKEKVL